VSNARPHDVARRAQRPPKDPEASKGASRADHHLPAEHRTTVTIHRKRFGALAVAVAVALPLTATTQMPASASTAASSKSLAKDLLPSSYAKKAGFTEVAEKITTNSKTGDKSCPHVAEEAFENASGQLGLVSEAVACTTSHGAATLLSGARSGTSATSARPPGQLGSSAIERSSGGSTYAIYWQRGQTVEAVAFTTDVPASSSSTSTSVAAPPITPAEQKVLSSAAVEQDGLLG
jgi:hypothetical protein